MKDPLARQLFEDFCSVTQIYLNQAKDFTNDQYCEHLRQITAGIGTFIVHYMLNTGSSDPVELCDTTFNTVRQLISAEVKKKE